MSEQKHEPRVTGSPETIWLVYGDLEDDDTHAACCAIADVTWCEDAQFPSDVRYLRADLLHQEARQIAARAVAAERERCSVLTEDMLRYAMAALGTGSPAEAERFRAFWLHVMTARDTKV